MARKLELGQRSVVDGNGLDEVFDGAEYPMKIVVTNHMPREISLPELGLFMGHVASPDGSNKQITNLVGLDQLRRATSSIEQISMLNGYEFAAITIEEVIDVSLDPDESNEDQGDDKSKGDDDSGGDESDDESNNGSSGGGDASGSDASKTSATNNTKTTVTSKKHKGD